MKKTLLVALAVFLGAGLMLYLFREAIKEAAFALESLAPVTGAQARPEVEP